MMNDEILRINGFEIAEDGFDQDKNKYYEGIFTQGNGYFHVRGSFEEGLADAPQRCALPLCHDLLSMQSK